MKKIKSFIALLASLCIGFTATGLVACGGDNGKDKDPDSSYTDPDKDKDKDEVVDIELESGFNVKAVDSNKNPIANAYFNIGYYSAADGGNCFITGSGAVTQEKSAAALLKTDANGIARLNVASDSTKTYILFLADPANISASGSTPATPRGYSPNFGAGVAGVQFTEVEDGKYYAKANFTPDNSWGSLFDPEDNLVYTRYYPDYYKDELTVNYTPYVKDAKAGQLNYFIFEPYRAPMPAEDTSPELTDAVMAKGKKAASGIYRISWTADDPDAFVLLNLYSFSGGNYFQSNDDGSPTETYVLMHTGNAPTDTATLQAAYAKYSAWYGSDAQNYDNWLTSYKNTYSGKNYITLELTTDTSTIGYDFGYVADKNCKVTISVERIGDAAVWTTEEVTISMPDNQPKAQKEEGSVINVPLSASTVAVKGDDGYYHLGSKNGKIIYVQLTKPTRVNTTMSMAALANPKNTGDRPQFVISEDVFDEASNSGIHYYNNYANVVSGYAELANSDGLYPVNDILKTILEFFCKDMLNYQQYGESFWVAACQYYGETADGTENRPYLLEVGDNTVALSSGSAWVSFTPSSSGYYEFNYNVPGSVLANGKYYISLTGQQELKFKATGSGSTVNIKVSTIAENRYLKYYSTETDNGQVWHGTESHPLSFNNLLVHLVTIDHTAYNLPLYVNIKFGTSLMNGNYIIHVAGSSGYSLQIKVNNGYVNYGGSAIALSASETTSLKLDSSKDETFFIWLEKAA